MNKKMLEKLIILTEECLSQYWQHNYQYVLDYCSQDIIWIGSTMKQFMKGIAMVEKDFKEIDKELKRCHLKNQQFIVAGNDTKSCTICGKYLVTTDMDEDIFLQVQQRCTFQWKLIDQEPRIECIHVSNPIGELHLNKGEKFPNWLGKQSSRYLNHMISLIKKQKSFSLVDKNGVTQFININEIEYVKADGHGIILYLHDNEITIFISFSNFMQSYGKELLKVRRSYAINPIYIKSIKNRELKMQNGGIIILPEKKVATIRKTLKEIFEN